MDVTVTVTGSGDARDLGALGDWLRDEPELRGRVRLADKPPVPGSMGGLADALTVAVGPGAAATVFASALVTWIRHRTGSARYRLTRRDGTVIEVSAEHVRGLDAAAVRQQVSDLVRALEDRAGHD